MNYLFEVLDNREISILFWLIISFLFLIIYKETRKSVFQMIGIIISSQIGTVILLIFTYILSIVVILQKYGFWEVSLIKETIIWTFGFAIIAALSTNKKSKEAGYFRRILLDNFKLLVIVEFITNFYVFSLKYELILIPSIVFISLLTAYVEVYSKDKPELIPVKKLFDSILIIFGIGVSSFIIYKLFTDIDSLLTLFNLKEFLLPIILTILFIPFIYFITLYSVYESFWIRLKFIIRGDKKLLRLAKFKILTKCNFNLNKLNLISGEIGKKRIEDKDQLKLVLKEIIEKR